MGLNTEILEHLVIQILIFQIMENFTYFFSTLNTQTVSLMSSNDL